MVRFGLGGETQAGGTRAATGLLWVVVVFTSMLALVRSFAQEREHGIWDGILSAPIDRAAIWAARSTATLTFLVVTQIVALPLFWLFFLQEGRAPSLWVLAGGAAAGRPGRGDARLAAGRAGLPGARPGGAAAGAVPALRGAARDGRRARDRRPISPQTSGFGTLEGLGFLALYDTIFGLLGWALFEYVVED